MGNDVMQKTRPDLVRKEDYLSADFAARENDLLWPRTWLLAARQDQFKRTGDFVRFDIAGESIVIVRRRDESLAAFYNVCQHRGRPLVDELSGNIGNRFFCRYHAWTYDLDGAADYIKSVDDWDHCSSLNAKSTSLKKLRLECWGGWVWVSMDPDIEPLADYLAPVADMLDPFEIDRCHPYWSVSVRVRCNWKTALEAFNEAYHVEGTHPQMNKYGGTSTKAPAHPIGKHAAIRISRGAPGQKSASGVVGVDPRVGIAMNARELAGTLQALYVDHYLRAAERLAVEPARSDNPMADLRALHREEMEKAGARWPDRLTDDHIAAVGDTFHLFPNVVFLLSFNGALCYRIRPDGDRPDSCVFDIWSLGRHAPGQEPDYANRTFPSVEAFEGVNSFLQQDFSNMERVQQGMKSRGFEVALINPVQERAISHLHEMIDRYLARG